MAYIDKTYYDTEFMGKEVSENEFAVLSERASDIIDAITMQRIVAAGFDTLSDAVQAAVKKATAAQVEMLVSQGGIGAVTGNADSSTTSMSLGKFSVTKSNKMKTINGIPVSPLISGYLTGTGLTYRGAYP